MSSEIVVITNTTFALEMAGRLFEDLAIFGFKNIIKSRTSINPYPILDLPNLVHVMTDNTISLSKLDEIINLCKFVMHRLTEFDCSCTSHLEMKQYHGKIWKAGKVLYEPYYCYNYRITDLAQVYPFVIEWVLKRDNMILDYDKESYMMMALMIARLISSLTRVGYKDVEFIKFYKACRHNNQCSCAKRSIRYLDIKKLVYILSDGGNIGREGLTKLYSYLQKGIQEIDGRWSVWFEDRSQKIPFKTFSQGKVEILILDGHIYYLDNLALVSQVVCLFLLNEKPDLSY
ncbi:hypothetical protein H012_gp073 [Acanthamoeba polyphaga moumouvirus]|uniref:Uncharacterized protein n=1 Tax=Acanthamoeba polyphaga moumouvirus TaxID=1269028 RepID=L7RGV7_9VIRU|nr:hypothetical protein H012_gp073 [Acanthamoeba polyphaga moumouvirus]AGC02375.1 hypothetical protein Moumou_00860 [Acanthamoeba polyphaga moumouvirus]